MTIALFSHNDLDGKSPVVLAKLVFEKVDYQCLANKDVDDALSTWLTKHQNDSTPLYITDISPSETVAEKIQKRFEERKEVVLIDHHKSALWLNRYLWANVIEALPDGTKTCATSLFYSYLIKKGFTFQHRGKVERFSEIVRQYDTWDWVKCDDGSVAKRMNDLCYMQENFIQMMKEKLSRNFSDLFSPDETLMLDLEETRIHMYKQQKEKQVRAKEVTINDTNYKVAIVHAEQYHSELGHHIAEISHPETDFTVLVNMGEKKVSFREKETSDIDLSEIAVHYRGGGHKKAAGCPLYPGAFVDFVL